jgi:lipopolysaccharide export system protein LptA
MKFLIILTIFLVCSVFAQELKIKANSFNADEKTGISLFKGDVNIVKGNDALKAEEVIIYTDKMHEPIKFMATGNVEFTIYTKNGSIYKGEAQKVVYLPHSKEYHFFRKVHLVQVDEKKEIIGEEVVLKTIEGKAYAKGVDSKPVIMIFDMPQEKEEL